MNDEQRQEIGADEFLFLSLIKLLSEQAWIALGRVVHPETGETQKDLAQAQGLIDILGVLEKRTKGNLSSMEQGYLKQELTNLRLTYVADSKDGEGETSSSTGGEDEKGKPAVDAAPAGKATKEPVKEGRVVEEDEDGRPKVVDRRSSSADTD